MIRFRLETYGHLPPLGSRHRQRVHDAFRARHLDKVRGLLAKGWKIDKDTEYITDAGIDVIRYSTPFFRGTPNEHQQDGT